MKFLTFCVFIFYLFYFLDKQFSKSEVFQNLQCCYPFYIPKLNLLVWAKIKDYYKD